MKQTLEKLNVTTIKDPDKLKKLVKILNSMAMDENIAMNRGGWEALLENGFRPFSDNAGEVRALRNLLEYSISDFPEYIYSNMISIFSVAESMVRVTRTMLWNSEDKILAGFKVPIEKVIE